MNVQTQRCWENHAAPSAFHYLLQQVQELNTIISSWSKFTFWSLIVELLNEKTLLIIFPFLCNTGLCDSTQFHVAFKQYIKHLFSLGLKKSVYLLKDCETGGWRVTIATALQRLISSSESFYRNKYFPALQGNSFLCLLLVRNLYSIWQMCPAYKKKQN